MSWYECDSLPQSFNVVSQGSTKMIRENDLTLQVGSGGLLLVKRSPSPSPSCCSASSPPPPPSFDQHGSNLHYHLDRQHPYEVVRRLEEQKDSNGRLILCHPHIPMVVLEYLCFDEQKQFRTLNSSSRDAANAFFQASAFECAYNLLKWGKFSLAVAPLELIDKNTPARALGFFDRIATVPEQADFVGQLEDALKRPFYAWSAVIVPDSEKFLAGYDHFKHRSNYVQFRTPDGDPWLMIGRAETLEICWEHRTKQVSCIIVPGMKRIPNCLFRNTNLGKICFENAQEITQIGHRFLQNCRINELEDIDFTGFCNVKIIGRLFLADTAISNFALPDAMAFGIMQLGSGFLNKCHRLSFVDLSGFYGLKTTRKWFCEKCDQLDGASQFLLPHECGRHHAAACAVEDWETRKEEAEERRRRGRR